jgi:hypothetical protein
VFGDDGLECRARRLNPAQPQERQTFFDMTVEGQVVMSQAGSQFTFGVKYPVLPGVLLDQPDDPQERDDPVDQNPLRRGQSLLKEIRFLLRWLNECPSANFGSPHPRE